jgi:asparagine synthase (glutamine-hydrolysing)
LPNPGALRGIDGDWTVGTLQRERIVAATSAVGAMPVYWAWDRSGSPHLGDDVFDVAHRAGLGWRWNWRAVRSLALLGHTVGRDTLHPGVFRIPHDSLVTLEGGMVHEHSLGFWDSLSCGGGSIREVVDALLEAVKLQVGDAPVLLSLSAGYDSRLLLALCLALGIRPRCVTVGPTDATDVELATEICRREGLEHQRVELLPEDYLAIGADVARWTSGVKLAGNWHTAFYARAAARDAREIHLVGSNGEFARNYFLHQRLLRGYASAPAFTLPGYWLARLLRRRAKFPSLDLLSRGAVGDVLRAVLHRCPRRGRADEALARFYATERVRHFIGQGLILYSRFGQPRAPFLEAEVLGAIWRLPRSAWADDRFHRDAIGMLRPELLELPFNRPLSISKPVRGYAKFFEVARTPSVREIILDCAPLDELFDRTERERAWRRGRTEELELLLTLALASEAIEYGGEDLRGMHSIRGSPSGA